MDQEPMSKLAQARIEKGLTQTQVAGAVGVSVITVCRWEHSNTKPYPRHVKQLCDVLDKTAVELGLAPSPDEVEEEGQEDLSFPLAIEPSPKGGNAFVKFFQCDIELRLQHVMYDWLHSKPSRSNAILQHLISQELEDYKTMTNESKQNLASADITRRAALRHLALLPIRALGLDALGTVPSWAPEDILTHCAAGITACGHLSKGPRDDMALVYSVLSTYLPPLQTIVEESSQHRQEAARLVAQALHIKANLAVHREGPKRAANYERQALTYSKESGDVLLRLMILRRLAWIYSCNQWDKKALETVLRAKDILEHTEQGRIPFLVQSAVYAMVAPRQAKMGREDEASLAFKTARDTFTDDLYTSNCDPSIIQFYYSDILNDGGGTYCYLGKYDEAFELFSQIIDPETLVYKMPASSELLRIEIINRLALTSLKRSKKDKELSINLWTVGMQGATALRSDKRFTEALTSYDIMEALWPGDKRIKELRDLTRHW